MSEKSRRFSRGGVLNILLSLVLVAGLLPIMPAKALADEPAADLGSVHVIVENTTCPAPDAAWTGTLVDANVALSADSTMMSCVKAAIEGAGKTQVGADNGYISEIEGLAEHDGDDHDPEGKGYSGWMGTLNDWFTNEGFSSYSVANGRLAAGDEIRVMYTCTMYDLGNPNNTDRALAGITFSAGKLDKSFAKDTYSYTLTVPQGTASVKVTPTAANKNYQVRTFVGDTPYKRAADVPVADGATITVKSGYEDLNAANDAADAVAYTFTVKVGESGGAQPSATAPKMTVLNFVGTPAFNSEALYYDQPEGTLFQLDDQGNRTGETGLSDTCRNYAVYVSSGTESVKPAGESAVKIFKEGFVYNPQGCHSDVYVDDEPFITNKATNMAMAFDWWKTKLDLVNNKTKMSIHLLNKNTSEETTYTITFEIMGELSVDAVKNQIEALNPDELVWPDDTDDVTKVYRNYSNLSEEKKQQIPAELVQKLERCMEYVSNDRVPQTLEIAQPASMQYYLEGQPFNTTGLQLLAGYADGSTRTVKDAKYYTVEPSDGLTNETEVTITYNGLSVKHPVSIVSPSFAGSGTEQDPHLLSSAADLQNLSQLVAAGFATEGAFFRMTTNITLPENWAPIGCTKDGSIDIKKGQNLNAFRGTIDGAGYTVTVPVGEKPLIGYVWGAEIKNLNIYGERIDGYGLVNNLEGVGLSGNSVIIDNVTLKAGTNVVKSGLLGANLTTNGFAGCSAGFVATVRNCTIEEGVTVGCDGDQPYIGSIAGRMQGTVENCVSYATVKGTSYVGGIIGTRDNAMGECNVVNCTFGGTAEGSSNVGGIVGGGYSNQTAPNGGRPTITGCTVTGTVSGSSNVGGILGADEYVAQTWSNVAGSISNNTFTGKVSGTKNEGAIIGYLCSLNALDSIFGNLYSIDCGTEGVIGFLKYLDTNFENPTVMEGTVVFNTENGTSECPPVSGCSWKAGLNRTDDPLGADSHKLGKALSYFKVSTSVSAADPIKVGDTVTVDVIATANDGIAALSGVLDYDSTQFELVSVTRGAGLSEGASFLPAENAAEATFSFYNNEADAKNGIVVATATLKALKACDDATVSVKDGMAALEGNPVEQNVILGNVATVNVMADATKGDVNTTGKINIVDAQVIYDMSRGNYGENYASLALPAGWTHATLIWTANVNNDDAIDAADAFATQHFVHYGTWGASA